MEIHRQLQRNRLAGAVAIVTGVGEAVGSAVARRFAAEGARLVVADRASALVRETIHEIDGMGSTAVLVEADARTEAGASEIARVAIERYGRIDTLVHSLGLLPTALTTEVNGTEIEVDPRVFFPLVDRCAASMALQGEGSIVLVALVREGRQGAAYPLVQAAARTSVAGFVHAAAAEFYARGISVNAVEMEDLAGANGAARPAADAPLNFVNAYRKARRFEDVAQAARFLASSEARGITGQVLYVGGGVPPVWPSATFSPRHQERMESNYRQLFAHAEGAGP